MTYCFIWRDHGGRDASEKGFDNESFTFNAREKDRRAAAGDSGKLRHEDMVLQKQRYVKVIVSVYNCKRYDYKTEEEENEYVEDKVSQEDVETFCNSTSTPLRLQPEMMTKLESRAITQCLLEDEDIIEEVENSKAEDGLKEMLHDVVVIDK